MLIAPTEPGMLKAIGKTSSVPEQYGVDIMFGSRLGAVGVQRKEMNDFIASVRDGRLAREYPLMQRLAVAVLVVEGRSKWVDNGLGQSWDTKQFRNYMLSVQAKGVWVAETDNLGDTVDYVLALQDWANKERHTSLDTRPKPSGSWGSPESRDWQLFLAQSFPGIGVVQAERLVDHFGGQLPIAWTCDKQELGKVPGIGKGRLQKLWDALGGEG